MKLTLTGLLARTPAHPSSGLSVDCANYGFLGRLKLHLDRGSDQTTPSQAHERPNAGFCRLQRQGIHILLHWHLFRAVGLVLGSNLREQAVLRAEMNQLTFKTDHSLREAGASRFKLDLAGSANDPQRVSSRS